MYKFIPLLMQTSTTGIFWTYDHQLTLEFGCGMINLAKGSTFSQGQKCFYPTPTEEGGRGEGENERTLFSHNMPMGVPMASFVSRTFN